MNKPELTRKPYSASELSERWGIGMARPFDDDMGNVTVGISDMDFEGKGESRTYITYKSYGTIVALMSENGLKAWVANASYSISTSSHIHGAKWGLYKGGFEETGRAIWREDLCTSRYYAHHENVEYTEYRRSAKTRDQTMKDYAEVVKAKTRKSVYVPGQKRARQEKQLWYKVLTREGFANHGGSYTYDLPTFDEDSGKWIPGEWTDPIPQHQVDVCYRGYHVTRHPSSWMFPGCIVLVAETRGRPDIDYDKGAFTQIRLLRFITNEEATAVTWRSKTWR